CGGFDIIYRRDVHARIQGVAHPRDGAALPEFEKPFYGAERERIVPRFNGIVAVQGNLTTWIHAGVQFGFPLYGQCVLASGVDDNGEFRLLVGDDVYREVESAQLGLGQGIDRGTHMHVRGTAADYE